jgi:hypothetical protein
MTTKKKIPVLLLLVTAVAFSGLAAKASAGPGLQENKQKGQWPYLEFAYAKAYLYNLHNRLYGNHAIIKDNQLDKTTVGTGVLLNDDQVKILLEVINSDVTGLIPGLSKSYIPHHGIVFYNRDHQPAAYITICFDCEGLRVYPEIPMPRISEELPDKEIKRLLNLLERCKQVIRETQLPIFASPFEYQEMAARSGES